MLNKKADTGIGTLIIFIAMILVAAIAAGVLIQTATSLQNKALLSGERTKGQVSTSATVLLVYAEDASDDSAIETLFFKMKLISGSDAIKLADTLVEFDLSNQSADLNYWSAGNTTWSGDYTTLTPDLTDTGFATNGTTGTGNFSVEYLVRSPNWRNGYLQRGDIIKLAIQAPRKIQADEDVSVRVIPKIGSTTVIETAIPEVVTNKRVYIFP